MQKMPIQCFWLQPLIFNATYCFQWGLHLSKCHHVCECKSNVTLALPPIHVYIRYILYSTISTTKLQYLDVALVPWLNPLKNFCSLSKLFVRWVRCWLHFKTVYQIYDRYQVFLFESFIKLAVKISTSKEILSKQNSFLYTLCNIHNCIQSMYLTSKRHYRNKFI